VTLLGMAPRNLPRGATPLQDKASTNLSRIASKRLQTLNKLNCSMDEKMEQGIPMGLEPRARSSRSSSQVTSREPSRMPSRVPSRMPSRMPSHVPSRGSDRPVSVQGLYRPHVLDGATAMITRPPTAPANEATSLSQPHSKPQRPSSRSPSPPRASAPADRPRKVEPLRISTDEVIARELSLDDWAELDLTAGGVIRRFSAIQLPSLPPEVLSSPSRRASTMPPVDEPVCTKPSSDPLPCTYAAAAAAASANAEAEVIAEAAAAQRSPSCPSSANTPKKTNRPPQLMSVSASEEQAQGDTAIHGDSPDPVCLEPSSLTSTAASPHSSPSPRRKRKTPSRQTALSQQATLSPRTMRLLYKDQILQTLAKLPTGWDSSMVAASRVTHPAEQQAEELQQASNHQPTTRQTPWAIANAAASMRTTSSLPLTVSGGML
jgi:hypothetical protein